MAHKKLSVLYLSVVFGCIHAGVLHASAPGPVLGKIETLAPAPQYSFAYDVQDGFTGDSKAQFETRTGDVVQGSYSLIEADGTRRIVDYTADPINGFNAVVNREPAVATPIVAGRTLARPIAAAPVVQAPVAAPLITRTYGPARLTGPVISRTVATAPITAPILSRTVAAVPAPLTAPVPASPPAPVAAPLLRRPVAVAAPVYQAYTLPRAVATRVGVPLNYAAFVV